MSNRPRPANMTRPTWDETRWPTPAEWLDWLLEQDDDGRLYLAGRAIDDAQTAARCIEHGHDSLHTALGDVRAAHRIAADSADRFRDVLAECLSHIDENPGDDALVVELRQHFGKTGPEPTRWRDFCAGALSQVDQIRAARAEQEAE